MTLFASAVFASAARAGSESYSYVGDLFTDVLNDYDTSMTVAGSFTASSTFGRDLALHDVTSQVTSYSFFDGVQTLTDANSAIVRFKVATDGLCRLSDWEITFWDANGNFIDGIDMYRSAVARTSDGFIQAPCTNPCASLFVTDARHYGISGISPAPTSMLWSAPSSCPLFTDGFETGDVLQWSTVTP